MRQRTFMQVDVFTHTPYGGNPLAVVLDGEGLSDDAMQQFARWTNLSETTFVLPATAAARAQGADYRVRIFTPVGELPFAGHPTLGSCYAWLAHGGQPQADQVVQECAQGLIAIAQQADGLAFAAPPLQRSPVPADVQAQVLAALGLQAQHLRAAEWLNNGSRWMGLLLDHPDRLAQATPQADALQALGVKAGLCAVQASDAGCEPVLAVRAIFLTPTGIGEDPATGSLNASLAEWLSADGHITLPYQVHQGAAIGRTGRLRLYRSSDARLWVQGQVHACVQGQVLL